jgi:hypothetical protein
MDTQSPLSAKVSGIAIGTVSSVEDVKLVDLAGFDDIGLYLWQTFEMRFGQQKHSFYMGKIDRGGWTSVG